MFSSSSEQQHQGLAPSAKRLNKEPSSSSPSLARSDTIKAGYFDEGEKAGGGAAAAPLESSAAAGDLLPPPSSASSSLPSPEASAARLAALSAELERLQKNQVVLADALTRGRAVLVAPSAHRDGDGGEIDGDDEDDEDDETDGKHNHSTLTGALADPPLVDPSPGAQAAHRKKLQREEARARGGNSGSEFVSAGLCGFGVAEDLLRLDFAAIAFDESSASSSSSPNEEFRAAAFDEPQPKKQALRSLRSQAAELLPAGDPKLASFLKQLELQQRIILKMLSEGAGAGGVESFSSLIPASLPLSPLLKNPLARLAAAGMTVEDDEGTAALAAEGAAPRE